MAQKLLFSWHWYIPLQLNLNCVKQDQVIETFQDKIWSWKVIEIDKCKHLQGIIGMEGGLEGGGGYLHLVSAKTPLIEVDSDRESCV